MKSYARRALAITVAASAPAVVIAVAAAASISMSTPSRWTLAFVAIGWWVGTLLVLRAHLVEPLRALSNLLAGLREGDHSTRMRADTWDEHDPLAAAVREANALADILTEQRLGTVDATNLLRKVMAEVAVAVLAFDETGRLRLANRAAERMLGQPAERMRSQTAEELALAPCLQGETPRLMAPGFVPGTGRWELRRASFRQRGRPYTLLVLSDLSSALHEEERQAWKRLVRVLSHEINNSLAPISSVAEGLRARVIAGEQGPRLHADLGEGLALVAQRAEALARLMGAHAELARLPPPSPASMAVLAWVQRCAALEPRLTVAVHPGPAITLHADADQLDHLLINLIRNAADAVLADDNDNDNDNDNVNVVLSWQCDDETLVVHVEDRGPGLADTINLFVPLYSTKPGGNGIGLALARQIAQAHGGTLSLVNRDDGPGCRASLALPRSRTSAPA